MTTIGYIPESIASGSEGDPRALWDRQISTVRGATPTDRRRVGAQAVRRPRRIYPRQPRQPRPPRRAGLVAGLGERGDRAPCRPCLCRSES